MEERVEDQIKECKMKMWEKNEWTIKAERGRTYLILSYVHCLMKRNMKLYICICVCMYLYNIV